MKKVLIALIAFIFILGSVGAYDNNTIGFGQFIIHISISVLIIWIALHKTTH
jgi:hypothetical protein